MKRTQIYLPEQDHKELTAIAKKKKQPMVEVIRVYIKAGLKEEKSIDRSGKEVMRKLLNIKATGGPRDLSTNIDHYLYGGPKKKI